MPLVWRSQVLIILSCSAPGEESDVDMDVDMDMSAPPSPILKAASSSVILAEESIDRLDTLSRDDTVTTAAPVDGSTPAAPKATSDINALSLTLATGDLTGAPDVASAVSDDSVIPGLSLALKKQPTPAAGNAREQSRDGEAQVTLQDERTVPGNVFKDEQLVPVASTHNLEKPAADHVRSSLATEVPAEEAECDMDMSPPPSPSPSPVPQSPTISNRSSVPAEITPVASLSQPERQPPLAVGPSASAVATPVEAPQKPLPQAGDSTATPTPASVAPVVAGSEASTGDSGGSNALDVAQTPSSAPKKDAGPDVQASREGSPMMVESLLGLTEPPPIAESSVVPDDAVIAEGSPTVVDSMPISPTVQSASHPEQEQEEPDKEPLRKPADVGRERLIQVS